MLICDKVFRFFKIIKLFLNAFSLHNCADLLIFIYFIFYEWIDVVSKYILLLLQYHILNSICALGNEDDVFLA